MKNKFEKYDAFVDDVGTCFQRVLDGKYDYQLNDDLGKDFCTIGQMKSWGVKVCKTVTFGEPV